MTRVCITGHPLTATAALVWHGNLPRPLQQLLFDTADGAAPPVASPQPTALHRQHDAAGPIGERTLARVPAGTSPAWRQPAAACG